MPVLESEIDTHGETFKANTQFMQAAIDEFRGIERENRSHYDGGSRIGEVSVALFGLRTAVAGRSVRWLEPGYGGRKTVLSGCRYQHR